MSLYRVWCESCGWESVRQKDGVSGRKCPECQKANLRQEVLKPHTATTEDQPQ